MCDTHISFPCSPSSWSFGREWRNRERERRDEKGKWRERRGREIYLGQQNEAMVFHPRINTCLVLRVIWNKSVESGEIWKRTLSLIFFSHSLRYDESEDGEERRSGSKWEKIHFFIFCSLIELVNRWEWNEEEEKGEKKELASYSSQPILHLCIQEFFIFHPVSFRVRTSLSEPLLLRSSFSELPTSEGDSNGNCEESRFSHHSVFSSFNFLFLFSFFFFSASHSSSSSLSLMKWN